MSRYQKGKTSLDFTEAKDSEWQWHQLDRMQVSASLQADNNVWSMKLRVQDQGEDQRRPGKRLYVRTVKHVS